jgi:hypothetical protein
MFRSPGDDKKKSQSIIKRQVRNRLICCLEDCDSLLTIYEGPGSNSLCRKHQLDQIEYNGYGRYDRPHTFYRSDVCDCCGQNINDDPRWEKAQTFFSKILTEEQKHEVKRRYNHGDHDYRKADGGNDSAENTNAFCSFCHWVKTVINNDGRQVLKN